MTEYEYNGNKYTLKPDVLELYRDGIDLISERKKLIFEQTKGIDRSLILKYEKDLKNLRIEKLKAEKRGKETTEIEKKIADLEDKYEIDSEVQSINVYVSGCIEDAMLKLIMNKKLIPRIIPKLIDGDETTFNFNDFVFIENVVAKVILDFFFVTMKSSNT
jgi:hypothetical protein